MSIVRVLRTSSAAISHSSAPATSRTTSSSRRESAPWSAAAARGAADGLAERLDLARRLAASGLAPACGQAIGVCLALDRRLALARRRERNTGAEQDLGALGGVEPAMQLHRLAELLGGQLRVALGEGGLAERVRERGEGVGVPGLGGDPRQACAQACASPAHPAGRDKPAASAGP